MSQCLVVKREILERTSFWERIPKINGKTRGMIEFSPEEATETLELIENNGEFKERMGSRGIENNPEWQQVIFYGVIRKGDKLFVYQRGGEDSEYKETRLQSKVSVGVGGHIEPFDTKVIDSLYREVDEEIVFFREGQEVGLRDSEGKVDPNRLSRLANIRIIGILKDDVDAVGMVHLGLVCEVKLLDPETEVKIRGNGENIEGRMMNLREYRRWLKEGELVPEGWTEILMERMTSRFGALRGKERK